VTVSATEHGRSVLAREYWRCAGLAENARSEYNGAAAVADAFARETDKWTERAAYFLALLGGEVPENPIPGTIEDAVSRPAGT
jgi:hypothetical protein